LKNPMVCFPFFIYSVIFLDISAALPSNASFSMMLKQSIDKMASPSKPLLQAQFLFPILARQHPDT